MIVFNASDQYLLWPKLLKEYMRNLKSYESTLSFRQPSPLLTDTSATAIQSFAAYILQAKSCIFKSSGKRSFDFLLSYPEYMPIYGDCSLRRDPCGMGVRCHFFSLITRLPPNYTIYTKKTVCYLQCSILPVKQKMNLCNTYNSLSAVRSLQSVNKPYHLVHRISRIACRIISNINRQWEGGLFCQGRASPANLPIL